MAGPYSELLAERASVGGGVEGVEGAGPMIVTEGGGLAPLPAAEGSAEAEAELLGELIGARTWTPSTNPYAKLLAELIGVASPPPQQTGSELAVRPGASRQGEVVLRGGLVRPLAVYAAAATQGPATPDGGWLRNVDAQVGMQGLGVEMAAGPERMNWDRHRLRSALQELEVGDLDRLFERKRTGRQWMHRLGVRPQVSGLDTALWARAEDPA